jgi:hypothetical protein
MKGVVLEVRGKKALVMAEDGSFRRIRCRYPLYVGQVLELGRPERAPAWVAIPAALSLTAVLFLLFFLPRSLGGPVAYATLDINPSLEFGLGSRGEVKSAQGLDPEGVRVLANTDVRGLPLSRAVEEVVERAKEEGYVRPGGRIILALAPSRAVPLGGEIEREFQRAREVAGRWGQKEELRVIGVASEDPGAREEARKRKLSLGLYLVEKAVSPAVPGGVSEPGSAPVPVPRDLRPALEEKPGRPGGGRERKERPGRSVVPVLEDEGTGPGERSGGEDGKTGGGGAFEEGAPGSEDRKTGRTEGERLDEEKKREQKDMGEGGERREEKGDSGDDRSGSREKRDKEGKEGKKD